MPRPLDTSADARERQLAAIRALAPSDRLRLADEMSADIRALAASGDRRRRQQAEPADGPSDMKGGRREE
jgi:hypothetical protein